MSRLKTNLLSVSFLVLVISASTVIAHDFWLIPEFFKIPGGWKLHIYGQTGMNYPESLSSVTLDRVKSAKLVNKDKEINIITMKEIENSLVLEIMPPESGQWYVSLEVKQRRSDLTAEQFNNYLHEHKLNEIIELRKIRNETEKAITRVYEKAAKTLITVGVGGKEVWDKFLGHALEIIPMQNPELLAKGDKINLKVLYNGKPLEGALISAGYAGDEIVTGHIIEERTGKNGIAVFPISNAGKWYFNTIHVTEEKEIPDIEWHSYLATLTFEVK